MVVMAAAPEALGDNYGIYGFSGYSKDNVELIAKEPDDAFLAHDVEEYRGHGSKGSTAWGLPYVTQQKA